MTTEENMLKSMRILYVEDDEAIRKLMEKKLRRVAGEVLVAENGRQGLELYKQHMPDLVVSDVQMPEMDGLTMAGVIKAINRDAPVILTTAHSEIDSLLKAIEIGIDGYVIKPIRPELLMETLNRCAGSLYYKREVERKNQELRVLHESEMDDLAVANNIMSHIMRSDGLSDPQIRYFQRPARQFSGDIIAAARDGNGDLRIMLADVTGHGLQAALYLLPVSRVFYSMVKRGFMTGDIAREMNQTMREIAVTGRFIAAAVAHITRDGSSIEIWNGGIPSAIYIQKNGELHKFPSQHLPLGVVNAKAFDAATEIYHAGLAGALLLCSDGLTEAENASGEPFGETRFETLIRSSPPEELFDNIISALETHLGGGIAHDDLSIVLAQCSA
jgi:serine phosphatase RsbU (regulator of sigma subunit)